MSNLSERMNSTRGRWQEDQFPIRGRHQFPRDQKNLDESITEKVQVERTRDGTQPNVFDAMELEIEPSSSVEIVAETIQTDIASAEGQGNYECNLAIVENVSVGNESIDLSDDIETMVHQDVVQESEIIRDDNGIDVCVDLSGYHIPEHSLPPLGENDVIKGQEKVIEEANLLFTRLGKKKQGKEPRHHDELSKEKERRRQYQTTREGRVPIPGHQYRLKTEERERNPRHQYQSIREERERNGLDREGRDLRFIDQRESYPRLQDGYKSTRKGRGRNDQDQLRRMRRDRRVQDQFTVQEIKEHIDRKERRDASNRDESKREIVRNHRYQTTREGSSENYQGRSYQVQVKSARERNDARNRPLFGIQGSDYLGKEPRRIDQRPKEGREPRHLKRERQAREGRVPRDGSYRRWTRSRSRSRSSDKEKKRTKIERIEKGEIKMGKAGTKDFSIRPHLKPDKNQMRSQHQENVGRNWFDLPRDVMLLILSKVGVIEILLTLPLVCSLWRDLAKDPLLFRSVVLSEDDDHLHGEHIPVCRIVRKAAVMSCGSMVEFWCSNMMYVFVPQLQYLTRSGSSLKSLRLGSCSNLDITSVVEVVKCLPSLEDIYLNNPCCPKGALDVIGLRRLCLRGNCLTREGLQAILDGCRYLDYVHVKGFSNIKKLEGGYAKRYQCKYYLKDYEYGIEIWELELKLNDDCRPSLVGRSNGYEYSNLPFEDPHPTPILTLHRFAGSITVGINALESFMQSAQDIYIYLFKYG